MPTISSTTFQDPKPFNTVSLINQRNHIKELIDQGASSQALKEMCSLVIEFEIDKKDTPMLKCKEDLIKNKKNPFITSAEDIDYFDKICMFMNGTYCRGFKAVMNEDFFPTLDEPTEDKE
jgi:hypothetical protein